MIYMDNNATTRVAAEVVQNMTPFWREQYGNASSQAMTAKDINGNVLNVKTITNEYASPNEGEEGLWENLG